MHVHSLCMGLLYLPYNGGQHCLVWEEKTDDLNETREQELILSQNKSKVSFHSSPNKMEWMEICTSCMKCTVDTYDVGVGLTIGVPNGT